MKKNSLLILLILILPISIFAQKKNEKPNFSGHWNLDKKLSGNFSMNRETNNFTGSLIFKCPVNLFIEHNDPEIKIKSVEVCEQKDKTAKSLKTTEYSFTYFTDGRGEINKIDNNLVESKTAWDENKIFVTVYKPGAVNKEVEFTKEFIISKNGNEITERLRSTNNFSYINDSYRKIVFKKSK